jgi:hypothetical protein
MKSVPARLLESGPGMNAYALLVHLLNEDIAAAKKISAQDPAISGKTESLEANAIVQSTRYCGTFLRLSS